MDCRVTQTSSPNHSPVTEKKNHSNLLQPGLWSYMAVSIAPVLTYDAHFGSKHQGQSNRNADAVISHQVTDGPNPRLPYSSYDAPCHSLHTSNTVIRPCLMCLLQHWYDDNFFRLLPYRHGVCRMEEPVYDHDLSNPLNNFSKRCKQRFALGAEIYILCKDRGNLGLL